MPDMSRRCPRCSSEKREFRDDTLRSEFYTSFGKTGVLHIHTITYLCNDCGLIYVQEER